MKEKLLLFGLDVSGDPTAKATLGTLDDVERAVYEWRYQQFDAAMEQRSTHIDEGHLRKYLQTKHLHPDFQSIVAIKSFSMLHEDVLLLLRMYARAATGAIVEIGSYVGGSTVAIARGVMCAGQKVPFVAIEFGGGHPTHPDIPSDDIFEDLVKNVRAAGMSEYVDLINGDARDPIIVDRIKCRFGDRKISLLCIDADGALDLDFAVYSSMLAEDAIIVLDDYEAPTTPIKSVRIRPWVDKMVDAGLLRPLGIYGWGTWLGQVTGRFSQSVANLSSVAAQALADYDARKGPPGWRPAKR